MQVIFQRTVKDDGSVMAILEGIVEGKVSHLGKLDFPNKLLWTQFFKAIEKGSRVVRDLEIRLENAPLYAPEMAITGQGKQDAKTK